MSCLAKQTPVQAAKLFHPRTFCDFVCPPQKNIPEKTERKREKEGGSSSNRKFCSFLSGGQTGGGVIGTPVPTTLTSIEVLGKEKDERRVEEGEGDVGGAKERIHISSCQSKKRANVEGRKEAEK